eukprot:9259555-Pyramimonas_sp.AAC.4
MVPERNHEVLQKLQVTEKKARKERYRAALVFNFEARGDNNFQTEEAPLGLQEGSEGTLSEARGGMTYTTPAGPYQPRRSNVTSAPSCPAR